MYVYVCVCVYVFMYACVCVCVCACASINIHCKTSSRSSVYYTICRVTLRNSNLKQRTFYCTASNRNAALNPYIRVWITIYDIGVCSRIGIVWYGMVVWYPLLFMLLYTASRNNNIWVGVSLVAVSIDGSPRG